MENGEIMMKKREEVDESGYSEKKVDQNIDLQAGQWLDLNQGPTTQVNPQQTQNKSKKNKNKTQATSTKNVPAKNQKQQKTEEVKEEVPQQSLDPVVKRDKKILEAIDSVGIQLEKKIDIYLQKIVSNIDEAEVELREIIELQTTQKSLLQTLKWEAKGSLDVSKLSKQVQNLLK